MTGLKKDDEKSFTLPFPKEYHKKELAGKDAEFNVKVIQVQEVEKPEINDEFVKGLVVDLSLWMMPRSR